MCARQLLQNTDEGKITTISSCAWLVASVIVSNAWPEPSRPHADRVKRRCSHERIDRMPCWTFSRFQMKFDTIYVRLQLQTPRNGPMEAFKWPRQFSGSLNASRPPRQDQINWLQNCICVCARRLLLALSLDCQCGNKKNAMCRWTSSPLSNATQIERISCTAPRPSCRVE